MKQLALVFALSLLLSCSAKVIPVQGSYPEPPITYRSEKPFTEVWDKLIDMYAQNGLSIKLIDRSSGLIISDNSAITATWEDKNGKLYHPEANIVTPKSYNSLAQSQVGITQTVYNKSSLKKPSVLRGEWNVRLKEIQGGTLINVNLVNVTYSSLEGKVSVVKNLGAYKSTGKFEKLIADYIK